MQTALDLWLNFLSVFLLTTHINFRLEPELKEKAEKIYAEFGMCLGDALNLFLRQSVIVGGYPFAFRLPGYFDEAEIAAERKTTPDSFKAFSRKTKKEAKGESLSSALVRKEENVEKIVSKMDEEEKGHKEETGGDSGFKLESKTTHRRGNRVYTETTYTRTTPIPLDQPGEKKEAPKENAPEQPVQEQGPLLTADGRKPGRNDPCPCGSGKKYNRCHGR